MRVDAMVVAIVVMSVIVCATSLNKVNALAQIYDSVGDFHIANHTLLKRNKPRGKYQFGLI